MIKSGTFRASDLLKLEDAPTLNVCCTYVLSHIVRAETREDFDAITEALKGLVEFLRVKTEERFGTVS